MENLDQFEEGRSRLGERIGEGDERGDGKIGIFLIFFFFSTFEYSFLFSIKYVVNVFF